MIRALALLTMLLPADSAALQGSRLLPNGQNAIAQVASIRAATVATAQYTSYAADSTEHPIIGYTVPPGVLRAGNQFRFHVYGTALNGVGLPGVFSPFVNITQTTQIQAVGAGWQIPAGAGQPIAWEIEGQVTFSAPGSAITGSDQKFTTQVPSYTKSKGSNAGLVVGGMLKRTFTNTAANAGNVVGGNPLSGATNQQSLFVTTLDPNSATRVNPTQPVGITVSVFNDFFVSFTVQGGWIEAM